MFIKKRSGKMFSKGTILLLLYNNPFNKWAIQNTLTMYAKVLKYLKRNNVHIHIILYCNSIKVIIQKYIIMLQ